MPAYPVTIQVAEQVTLGKLITPREPFRQVVIPIYVVEDIPLQYTVAPKIPAVGSHPLHCIGPQVSKTEQIHAFEDKDISVNANNVAIFFIDEFLFVFVGFVSLGASSREPPKYYNT